MECPNCRSSMPDGLEFCTSCLGALCRDPGGGAIEANSVAVPAAGERMIRESAALVEPASTTASACPIHPDTPLGGVCDRCGAYLCARCVPDLVRSRKPKCPACRERAESKDRSALIRKLERGLWISFFVMGAVLGGFFIWIPFAFGSSSGWLLLAAVSSILVLGLIAAGVLFLITRRPVVAWIAVAIEGVFFVLHVVSFGPSFSLVYAAVFLVPVFSALQIVRLDSLRRDHTRDDA